MSLDTVSITHDKDYLEVVDDGQVLISTGATDADFDYPANPHQGTDLGVRQITHNLNAIPLVRAFYDPAKNGRWYSTYHFVPPFFSAPRDPHLSVVISGSAFKLGIVSELAGPQTNIPVFYRYYNPSNKSISSDAVIDNIFKKDVDHRTLGAAASETIPTNTIIAIPHGLTNQVPLWTLEFSLDQENWHMEGTELVGVPYADSGPPGGPYANYRKQFVYGSADATNFYVHYHNQSDVAKTIYVRYSLDYRVPPRLFSSDNDAYKNSGIKNTSLTISGTLVGGGRESYETPAIPIENLDYALIQFDNSAQHSGKYKNMALEQTTAVSETTVGSELLVVFEVQIIDDTFKVLAYLFNPYDFPVNLQTTTLHFQYIPYENTI